MLKEVKATKDAKCAKCGRDIKRGWTVFFDDGTKNIYCKYCASTVLPDKSSQLVSTDTSKSNDVVFDTLDSICTKLDKLQECTNIIQENVIILGTKFLKLKAEKKSTEPEK